ncbi:MAG TPA: hypothetical protein VK711_08485 [Puia sp.]|nr:hypothetical protein [Puia sp.]
MKNNKRVKISFVLLILFLSPFILLAQENDKAKPTPSPDEAAELAKKLANPIASLISVPFQNNTFYGIGSLKGTQNVMNFQPVIPFRINDNLNLITRYIIPVVTQYNITGENASQSGLGDATISAFLSPSHTKNGVTWGVGPAFLVPIATDVNLGTGKFGVGPTAVVLKQANGFTYGALANQIWSVAGQRDRPDVSQLFVQPFFTYNWKSGAGIGLVGSITQNWETNTNATSIAIPLTGITKFGKQIIQLAVGPQIPVTGTPKPDFGWRAQLVLIFPK